MCLGIIHHPLIVIHTVAVLLLRALSANLINYKLIWVYSRNLKRIFNDFWFKLPKSVEQFNGTDNPDLNNSQYISPMWHSFMEQEKIMYSKLPNWTHSQKGSSLTLILNKCWGLAQWHVLILLIEVKCLLFTKGNFLNHGCLGKIYWMFLYQMPLVIVRLSHSCSQLLKIF